MKQLSFIFLILTLFTSCISSKSLIKINEKESLSISKETLEGSYKNKNDSLNKNELDISFKTLNENSLYGALDGSGLYEILFSCNSLKPIEIKIPKNSVVRIKLKSNKKIQVELISKKIVIDKFELKGKFKKGYFFIRRKLLFFYTPILGVHNENKVLLTSDKNNDLIVLHGKEYHAWVLIGGKSRSDRNENIYERTKN